jgi:ParB-like chromosome segregation protein Spo0J
VTKDPLYPGKAVVVDGRQRTRAAIEADRRLREMGEPGLRVPVLVEDRRKTSDEHLMRIGISTNEFHMADNPVVKARKARRLLDRGLEESEIAICFGVSRKTVQNWLMIEGLPSSTRQSMEKGEISPTQGLELKDLTPDQQKTAIEELKSKNGGKSTARDAKEMVAKAKGVKADVVPSKRVLRYIVERKDHHPNLSDEFIRGVAYAIGLMGAEEVEGLAEVINNARSKVPAKKRGASPTNPMPLVT